jgi:hypothetical protein
MLVAVLHSSALRLLRDGMVAGSAPAPAVLVVVRRICEPWLAPGMMLRVGRRACGWQVAVVVPVLMVLVVRVVG